MDNIKERKPHDNIQHKLAELPGLLKIEPLFTGIVNRDSGEIHGMNRAFDSVNWIKKDAVIIGSDGKEKFRQNDVEVPDWWNDTTINIVAEKYFREGKEVMFGIAMGGIAFVGMSLICVYGAMYMNRNIK